LWIRRPDNEHRERSVKVDESSIDGNSDWILGLISSPLRSSLRRPMGYQFKQGKWKERPELVLLVDMIFNWLDLASQPLQNPIDMIPLCPLCT
jgi:hypothetical protein